MLDIPLLPRELRLQLDKKKGESDPVFVCRPVKFLDGADYAGRAYVNVGAYAQCFVEHLESIERLQIEGVPFDKTKREHIDALDPTWGIELGRKLLSATKLTEQERGK